MTTTTIIRKSTTSTTGYELVIIKDGHEEVHLLNDRPKNEPYTLILPENPSNRKYFSSKKVDAANGEIELTYKESKTFGPRSESSPRKGLEEYLEGEDKELYLALVEKAKKNREEAHKKTPMTALEKAQREVEKWLKKVEELKGEEA